MTASSRNSPQTPAGYPYGGRTLRGVSLGRSTGVHYAPVPWTPFDGFTVTAMCGETGVARRARSARLCVRCGELRAALIEAYRSQP